MGFSRQEYWSGLPFSSPGALPDPGNETVSPALQVDSLSTEPSGVSLDDWQQPPPGKQPSAKTELEKKWSRAGLLGTVLQPALATIGYHQGTPLTLWTAEKAPNLLLLTLF